MPARPRIVVWAPFDAVEAASRELADQVDFVRVAGRDEALSLIRAGDFDGVLLPDAIDPARGSTAVVPSSQVILERIATGIAVVESNFNICWHNQAFARLCDSRGLVGMGVYQALGCEEIEGPNFSPFTDCLGGTSSARTRLRLKSGRHVEATVQALLEPGESVATVSLCLLRDVTSEVREREKLIAIHRAGLELSHLSAAELAQMSTEERVDLLKANILQYSQNILSFKNLEIRLLDAETNRLNVLLSEGMTEVAGTRTLFAAAEGNGVTGFVAATGTSYLCDDVEHDPLYIPGARDAMSSLTVPIVYRERVIGTFNVESPEARHFTESDREFLEVFAREIAVALHNLELLQAEKRYGGSASVAAILGEVSLPVDEIVADTIRMFDYLHQPAENRDLAHEAIRRVLLNARAIKASIRRVGSKYEEPAVERDRIDVEPSALSGRRILVADGDPGVRRSAHSLLERAGCDVDTARDGGEAVRMVRAIPYDVILGDIRLPDMNGYEFFLQVRAARPQTPIALMTGFGYDASHSMVKARQEGLRVVLYKPFRFDRLCEAIEDALDPQLSKARASHLVSAPVKQSIL